MFELKNAVNFKEIKCNFSKVHMPFHVGCEDMLFSLHYRKIFSVSLTLFHVVGSFMKD
jgi:hypothetical protein